MKATRPFILVAVFCWTSIIAWFVQRRRIWDSEMAVLQANLVNQSLSKSDDVSPRQTWNDLPDPVQAYFRAVFANNSSLLKGENSIATLHMKQKGSFNLNSRWVPFTANQHVATHSPGFLWNARVSMGERIPLKWLQVFVCDAWVAGEATLRAFLFGAISLVPPLSSNDKELLIVGEASRWLTEALLVPTALLPYGGLVTWEPVDATQAKLVMSNPEFDVTVKFDHESHFIHSVSCLRPKVQDSGAFVWAPWYGLCNDYQMTEFGFYVPRKLDAGWLDDDDHVQYYFRGQNEELQYTVVSGKTDATVY